MLKDFNPSIMLEEEKQKQERLKTLTEENNKAKELRIKLDETINTQEKQANELNSQIENLQTENQNATIINKFLKNFKLGKSYKNDLEIQKIIKEKQKLEKELEENKNQKTIISNKEKSLQNQKETASEKINKCIKEEDGRLVITDEDYVEKFIDKPYEDIDIDIDKKVLVHSTSLFPKNHMLLTKYDGNYTETYDRAYRGVKKIVKGLYHRHTLHFTINNRVEKTSNGEGNWDDKIYMVIDQLKPIKNKIKHESPSDSWTGESIKLSNEAVILVKLQEKDKLKNEDLNDYKICYYDGDPIKCLRNFLKINNYDVIKTYSDDIQHSESLRNQQENLLLNRDLLINYMKDNKYLTRETPILSKEEMAILIDLACSNDGCEITCFSTSLNSKVEEIRKMIFPEKEKLELSEQRELDTLIGFVITMGVHKTEDGKYTFASDEKVYETLEKFKNMRFDAKPITIDKEQLYLIKEVYNLREELHKEYEEQKHPSFEEIASMQVKDLYKFENQLALETLQKSFKSCKHTYLCEIAEDYLRLKTKCSITPKENEERNLNVRQIFKEKGIIFENEVAEMLANETGGELGIRGHDVDTYFDKEATAQEILDKARMLSIRRDEIVDELKEELTRENNVTKR